MEPEYGCNVCIPANSYGVFVIITNFHIFTIPPLYPSITRVIRFHQTHGYISMPNDILTIIFKTHFLKNSSLKFIIKIHHWKNRWTTRTFRHIFTFFISAPYKKIRIQKHCENWINSIISNYWCNCKYYCIIYYNLGCKYVLII